MDLFTSHMLSRFKVSVLGMPEKPALTLLGALIEQGKDFFLKTIAEMGLSVKEGELEIRKLMICIAENSYFSDPYFSFSLDLALTHAAAKTEELLGRKLTQDEILASFKIRLDEIFPQELSYKIFQYALGNFLRKVHKPTTPQEYALMISSHFDTRKNLLQKYFDQPTKAQPLRPQGTDTLLISCPQCGLNKRCDAKTKHFRCKKCGFDSPYPFPAAS